MVPRCEERRLSCKSPRHWRSAVVLSILASLYCTLGKYARLQLDSLITDIDTDENGRSAASIDVSESSSRRDVAAGANLRNSTPLHSPYTCSINNEVISIPIAPHFIIPGVQKGGTTALYNFLNQHPNIQGSVKGEPHFFDWHYPHNRTGWLEHRNLSLKTSNEDIQCIVKKEYRDCFNITQDTPPGTIFFEKTPGYLVYGEIPKTILSTCHWKPKVVVILRNPVKRAFSHYQMQNYFRMPDEALGLSFEELVDLEMASLKDIGLSNAPNRTSTITTTDVVGFALPNRSKGELDMMHWEHHHRHKKTNYLQRGMYAALLRPWIEHFPLGESMIVLSHEQFSAHPEEVFSRLLEFIEAPPFTPAQGFSHRHNRQRTNETIRDSTTQYLTDFFRPHNELLADMLGEEWRGIWD